MTGPDFGALHAAMRKHVDDQLIPCVSTALLRGREAVDVFCYGFADRMAAVIGESGMGIVLRLFSFLLLCIGVQIMWNGASALVRSLALIVH